MPTLQQPLIDGIALIDVILSISDPAAEALRAANRPIPTPVKLKGLIDCGATGSAVDADYIMKLNLPPTSVAPIRLFDEIRFCATWDVALRILMNTGEADLYFPCVRCFSVVGLRDRLVANTHRIDVLIGMDILGKLIFTLDGMKNTFTLER